MAKEIIQIIILTVFAFFFVWCAEKAEAHKENNNKGFIVRIEILQYIFECIALGLVWFAAKIYYTSTLL